MIITCNQCESSFSIDERLIKGSGSKVKCSKCSNVFVAYPPSTTEEDGMASDVAGAAAVDAESDEPALRSVAQDGLSESTAPDGDPGQSSASGEIEARAADFEADYGATLPEEVNFEDSDGNQISSAAGMEDLQMDVDLADDEGSSETESESQLEFDVAETAGAGMGAEAAESEELDLFDLENALEEAADSGAASTESGDIDTASFLEPEVKADAASSGSSDNGFDELDLADLEKMLDKDETPVSADESGQGPPDLDLDLDMDMAEEASDVTAEGPQELDFSDLADILQTDEAPAAAEASDLASQELNLDLDSSETPEVELSEAGGVDEKDDLDFSDLADILETDEAPAAAEASDLESHELNLDLDLDEARDAQTAEIDGRDEEEKLDFGDLEDILETDEPAKLAGESDEDVQDLDLELDLDLDLEGDAQAAGSHEATAAAADDDFLDIEKMLEDSADAEDEQASQTVGESQAGVSAGQSSDDEFELEFDLDGLPKDSGTTSFAQDEELEIQLLNADQEMSSEDSETAFQDTSADAGHTADDMDEFDTDEFTTGSDLSGQTEMLEPAVAAAAAAESVSRKAPRRKRSRKKPVFALLAVVVFVLGVLIIPKSLGIHIPYISDLNIPYISDVDLKIPYLSDLLSQKSTDVIGNLRMMPLEKTINGRFVSNSKSGRLFVIEGKIQNAYTEPRSFVKVTGKLFQKGGTLAGSSTVFCGNVLSGEELGSMDLTTMNRRLQNSFGERKSNLKIESGATVPFMIVFANLANNLDEFTVEVAGSAAGKGR